MKKIVKKLSLFLVIIMLVTTLATPAVSADSLANPYIVLDDSTKNLKINVNQTGKLVFYIYNAENYYSSAQYCIYLYNSEGEEVAWIEELVEAGGSPFKLTLSIDTAALRLPAGTYSLEYYMVWKEDGEWWQNYESYDTVTIVDVPRFEADGAGYRYYVNGQPSYATGIFKVNSSYFYVANGYWQNSFTGLVKFSGKYFYVENGKWKSSYKGLIKFKGSWFYIEKGKWASGVTTLVKVNGKWLFVENGKWKSQNVLVKYQNKYFYVKAGKWQNTYTGFVYYNGTYFYVVSGKWANKTTTLVKYKGVYHYVKNGKFCETTTIFKYKGVRFYIKYGVAQTKYSGRIFYNGKYYTIKKGKVV